MEATTTQYAGFRFASAENVEKAKHAEERVFNEIRRLGLEKHVRDLDENGYTVLHPDELDEPVLTQRLRDKILEVAERRHGVKADLEKGLTAHDSKTPFGEGIYLKGVLFEDPIFELPMQHPKQLALITYLLGESCKLSHTSATIKEQGAEFLELHVDSSGHPEPLSAYAEQANATWLLTDYSRENGGTCFTPGSHNLRRPPKPDESIDFSQVVPVEAKAGSLAIWGGNTWHAGLPRVVPGLRVSLMSMYVRWYSYIVDSDMKSRVTPEMLDRNPPRFRKLLGFDQPSAVKSDDPNIKTMAETQYNRFA